MKTNCVINYVVAGTLVFLGLIVSGCASTRSTQSGFLKDYAALQPVEGKSCAKAKVMESKLESLVLAPVELRAELEHTHLKPGQAEELCALAQAELRRALGGRFKIVQAGDEAGAPCLRAAITRIDTSNVAVNYVSILALFVPVDNGGVGLEWKLEKEGPASVMAEGVNVSVGKPWQLSGAFKRTGHARSGLAEIADDIAKTLAGPTTY